MKRFFAVILLLGCHRRDHDPAPATERETKGRDQAVMGGEGAHVRDAAANPFRVHRRPFFVDVNGDGHDDAIVVGDSSGAPFAYAALDGTNANILWKSDPLAHWSDPMAVVGGVLLTYSAAGELAAYDFKGSKTIWQVPLGERVERLCESSDAGAVRVELADKRSLMVTVATGALVASTDKVPCRPVATNAFSFEQTYSEPVGATVREGDHIQCGKTKAHADPCPARAHMDLETLDGIGVSELVALGDGGFVLLGVHRPGTGYPVVGVLRARALVWKSDVPDGNPLLAQANPPFSSAIAKGELFVSYPAGRTAFITAFSIATGHRDWLVQFKLDRTPKLYASNDTIFGFADLSDGLVAFAPDTGATRFSLDRGY